MLREKVDATKVGKATCVALFLVKSNLLESFLSNRRLSGFRQSGQTRPCESARRPCAGVLAPGTHGGRRRPGPDLENGLSVRSPSRIVQSVAYRIVSNRYSPTDVSRPSSAAKVHVKERHELLLATWASRRPQSGAAHLRVITLSKEALLKRLKMADCIWSENGSTYSIRFI
jgi:hypothetical protein